MTIPTYKELILPMLNFLSDEKMHSLGEVIEYIIEHYSLIEEEITRLLPNGSKTIIYNRVRRGKIYLKQAELIIVPQKGYLKITRDGLDMLNRSPKELDIKFSEQLPDSPKLKSIRKEPRTEMNEDITNENQTINNDSLDHTIDMDIESLDTDLDQKLLEKLRNKSIMFFEKLILRLLSDMGYGEVEVTGRSINGGIDGLITQDKLGLDKIYLKAENPDENQPVTPSRVQNFIGALELSGIDKGVFITTSRFLKNTNQSLLRINKNIILIDGEKLVELMKEYNLGVKIEKIFKKFEIDSDFFDKKE